MKKTKGKHGRQKGGVIRLEDLVPRKDVRGGSGGILFGQRVEPPEVPGKAKGQLRATDAQADPSEKE